MGKGKNIKITKLLTKYKNPPIRWVNFNCNGILERKKPTFSSDHSFGH